MYKPATNSSWLKLAGALVFCLTLLSCAYARSAQESFSFTALQLPQKSYFMLRVLSSEEGTFAGLCSPTGVMDEQMTLNKYQIGGKAIHILFSAPAPRAKSEQRHPELVLPDNRILQRWMEKPGDSSARIKERVHWEIKDSQKGTVKDVTPSNIAETPDWLCFSGPPFLWSEKHGLVYFCLVPEKGEIRVWQGKDSLKEVQVISDVIGMGQAFVDGVLSAVLIRSQGVPLAYNFNSGRFVEDKRYDAIGREIRKIIGQPAGKPPMFAMALGLAILKRSDLDKFILVSAEGTTLALPRLHPFDKRPDGSRRSDAEVLKLSFDARPLVEEGKNLPANRVSTTATYLPVDDKRVGLLDVAYQRLVVIAPRE